MLVLAHFIRLSRRAPKNNNFHHSKHDPVGGDGVDGLSVTKFDTLLTLWQNLSCLGNFFTVYFVFGKILNQLWQEIMLLAKFSLLY